MNFIVGWIVMSLFIWLCRRIRIILLFLILFILNLFPLILFISSHIWHWQVENTIQSPQQSVFKLSFIFLNFNREFSFLDLREDLLEELYLVVEDREGSVAIFETT